MSLIQHTSIDARFQQQVLNADKYLIPFIEKGMSLTAESRVMEIGCGEGGVLKPFLERGIYCLGVDLAESRIANAKQYMEVEVKAGQADFIVQNVLEDAFLEKYRHSFDLVILKDTIEHIPDQESFIPYLKHFLKPEGKIFFGFPPWYMPFGGHQQICKSRFLSKLPYYHILPRSIYTSILKAGKETPKMIDDLLEIKDTGITIQRFEKILKEHDFTIDQKTLFLFNPIYEYKFGLKPREQFGLIAGIPGVREMLTTAGWYLVGI